MFAEKLKKLRIERSMTQQDLAKVLKVSPSTIGMYEQGRRQPDLDTLITLSAFFNVSMDKLVGTNNENSYREEVNNKNDKEPTIALHNENGYDENLPPEAKKELEDFIEFLKHKYGKNK